MVDLDFYSKFRSTIEKIEQVGLAYAEAKSQSWQAQELKHSILASIMAGFGDVPKTKAESMARATEDYKRYIKETAESIRKELCLRAEYEKWKSSFEALRSLSSLEKVTRNLSE